MTLCVCCDENIQLVETTHVTCRLSVNTAYTLQSDRSVSTRDSAGNVTLATEFEICDSKLMNELILTTSLGIKLGHESKIQL